MRGGNFKRQNALGESPADRFSDRSSILLGSTKKKSTQRGAFLFAIIKGESKGAVVNDVPAARQSRDDRAGVEPARIDSPRVHQKGKRPGGAFLFAIIKENRRER